MAAENDLKDIRCAWVTPVLGVRGRLLYFGPLLAALASEFREFRVFTGEFAGDAAAAPFAIEQCGSFRRLYQDDRLSKQQSGSYVTGVSIATPVVLSRLLKARWDLVVVNEFSLFCFYACLVRLLRPGTRILCIVESRPRFRDTRLMGTARRLFRRLVAAFAHQFLTNNQSGRAYLEQELGIAPDRILSQPYLISDLGGPPPAVRHWSPAERPLVFVYAGDLVKRKGVHLAIGAFRQLSPERRRLVRFLIAGDGPYRPDLDALVQEHGLGDVVTFLGRQPFEQMRALYDQADVFLFPSLGDYRALTTFEAMSRGAAILGSVHDGGTGETVAEGLNGFAVDPADTALLATRIAQLLDQPELVARFSARSIEMARPYNGAAAIQALRNACLRALG